MRDQSATFLLVRATPARLSKASWVEAHGTEARGSAR
jgi:hypothetical protein